MFRLWSRCRPTIRYLMETEAHVYALAVAASVLLAFYPFLIVMLSFCRNVLNWPAAVEAIYLALNDFFPGELGSFIRRNLPARGTMQITSMFLLLFTANGVFEPLEVALNRTWGVKCNRSYLKNQLVSLGLIFACGALALLSLILTALNREWVGSVAGQHEPLELWINLLLFKLAAVPISIFALFLVYWLLPNRRIAAVRVAPVAILVGLVLEGMKYVNQLVLPLLTGETPARVWRFSQFRDHPAVEFRRVADRAGGRGMGGAAGSRARAGRRPGRSGRGNAILKVQMELVWIVLIAVGVFLLNRFAGLG